MENNYAKWYDREKAWIEEISRRERKQSVRRKSKELFFVLISTSGVSLWMMGSRANEENWSFGRISIILPLLFVFALIFYMKRKSTPLVRLYMKNIEAQIAAFSPAEREEFATQMLESENRDIVRSFFFVGRYSGKLTRDRVYITKDYAMKSQSGGRIVLVKFAQVERMTLNEEESQQADWTGINDEQLYPICFYYHAGKNGAGEPDKTIIFDDPDMRREVADCIREMSKYTVFTVGD